MSPESLSLGGVFEIDSDTHCLFFDGSPVEADAQDVRVLECLFDHESQVVSKEAIRAAAWQGRNVSINSVHQSVAKLRKILDKYAPDHPVWIVTDHGHGYRLECKPGGLRKRVPAIVEPARDSQDGGIRPHPMDGNKIEQTGVRISERAESVAQLPEALSNRIDDLLLPDEISAATRRLLGSPLFPTAMSLSSEMVINPIWRLISEENRRRLAKMFSPKKAMPPRIMHLDIFLLRADDAEGRPLLLNYFSGKPKSGWQAFMLPFRHKRPGETESVRQERNAEDIAEFLGMKADRITVESLGDEFVISVKPDPGYEELVLYIFEFCSVTFSSAPEWLAQLAPEMPLHDSVRHFRWFHPEEMELQERTVLVDGDVLRGVHYFFGTTLPTVPVGFPSVFLK